MLRLFLDAHHGLSGIPCPACSYPLLPAIRRMGRLLVAYDGHFRLRPGRRALLVCSNYRCEHEEPVVIAATSVDAVAYSAMRAVERWRFQTDEWGQSPAEIQQEIVRLRSLLRETGNPKLHSVIRSFRRHYNSQLEDLTDQVENAYEDGLEVLWEGLEHEERGRILALTHDGVLFERSDSGEVLLLSIADLADITYLDDDYLLQLHTYGSPAPVRFDFGERPNIPKNLHTIHTPVRFVVVGGYSLALDFVTRHQVVRAKTQDKVAAEALGMWLQGYDWYVGEFPVGLVERSYRHVRHCWVAGHRLFFECDTNHPDIVYLSTRHLEVARELQMTRRVWAQTKGLRWSGYFYRHEITEWEERQSNTRRPRHPRRHKFHFIPVG